MLLALNSGEQSFVAIAKVVFELTEADTNELHIQYYPIGAKSPVQT